MSDSGVDAVLDAIQTRPAKGSPLRTVSLVGALSVTLLTVTLATITIQNVSPARKWNAVLHVRSEPEFIVCRCWIIDKTGQRRPHYTHWNSKKAKRTEIYFPPRRSVSVIANGTVTTHDLVTDRWTVRPVANAVLDLPFSVDPLTDILENGFAKDVAEPARKVRDGVLVEEYKLSSASEKVTVWVDAKTKLTLGMEVWGEIDPTLRPMLAETGHRLVLFEYPESLPASLFELKKP